MSVFPDAKQFVTMTIEIQRLEYPTRVIQFSSKTLQNIFETKIKHSYLVLPKIGWFHLEELVLEKWKTRKTKSQLNTKLSKTTNCGLTK